MGLFERETGKEIPSPNKVVRAMCAEKIKGDYNLRSEMNGAVQHVMFADPKEAENFVKALKATRYIGTPPKPCKALFNVQVRTEANLRLARQYRLL